MTEPIDLDTNKVELVWFEGGVKIRFFHPATTYGQWIEIIISKKQLKRLENLSKI